MLVEDIMTTGIPRVDIGETLDAAVEAMLRNEVTYSVIVDDDIPSGIVTERDALAACYETGNALDDIPVDPFASGLSISVQPDVTVLSAVATMTKYDVDILPVMNGLELLGILSKREVVENVSNIRREAFEIRINEHE